MCQYSQDQKFTNKEIDSFLLNQKDLEEISILRFFNNMHIACRNMHVAIEYIASSTYLWRSPSSDYAPSEISYFLHAQQYHKVVCVCVCVVLTTGSGELPYYAVSTARLIHPPQRLRCHNSARLCTPASP